MKILYMAYNFIDNYGYQENYLSRINKQDGHEVEVIASTYSFVDNDNNKIVYTEPRDYYNEDGIKVTKRKYKKYVNQWFSEKIKKISNVQSMIEKFDPDVIFFQGTGSYDIVTVSKYKKKHKNVKFYICSHTDLYTSATNWLSKNILHAIVYKKWLHYALPYVDRIFYITDPCKKFLTEIYKIPEEKTEFLPLGGVIPSKEEIYEAKATVSKELGIDKDSLIFLQAGKIDARKKIIETLDIFNRAHNLNAAFIIVGSLSEDVKDDVEEFVNKDIRIHYLGWKNDKDLCTYINACDVYIQPGKVSAIMQSAICRSCAMLINDLPDYRPFVTENGWLIKNTDEIVKIFADIGSGSVDIEKMKEKSTEIARKFFDYNTIAKRLYL